MPTSRVTALLCEVGWGGDIMHKWHVYGLIVYVIAAVRLLLY